MLDDSPCEGLYIGRPIVPQQDHGPAKGPQLFRRGDKIVFEAHNREKIGYWVIRGQVATLSFGTKEIRDGSMYEQGENSSSSERQRDEGSKIRLLSGQGSLYSLDLIRLQVHTCREGRRVCLSLGVDPI